MGGPETPHENKDNGDNGRRGPDTTEAVARHAPGSNVSGLQSRCGGSPQEKKGAPPNLRGRDRTEEPLEGSQGCREMTIYLDWVSSQPYCREAFAQGARLGTAALQAAGGWQAAPRVGEEAGR